MFFLGEIPRITDFEAKTTSFIMKEGTPDFVMDDTSLALMLPSGLFVITGCGHSGIVNTLEYARKVAGVNKLSGIMGGFHLFERDKQTNETIRYLRENEIGHVYPCHCTALPALSAFNRYFPIKGARTGDVYVFE